MNTRPMTLATSTRAPFLVIDPDATARRAGRKVQRAQELIFARRKQPAPRAGPRMVAGVTTSAPALSVF